VGITDSKPGVTVETVTQMDDRLREIIIQIDEAAFGPGSLNKWTLPLFMHYGVVYIARYHSEPAGVAELIRDRRDPELVYLYGYAVAPQFRGEGIGTILFHSIIESMPPAGFRRLQLTVHPENQIALHIYRDKFGMRTLDYISDYYGPGEDRWLLEWSWEG
jgi:ribosomal protein S18 acetylase RimI-like enzyme